MNSLVISYLLKLIDKAFTNNQQVTPYLIGMTNELAFFLVEVTVELTLIILE
jgi:hypothetical protein